jgi:hypothetical protein
MMIGYNIYDRFTMEHFPLRQRMTLTTKIYCSRLSTCNGFWFLHRHFTCSSNNPRILAPLIIIIIFQQNLKYKSCRVKKNVPKFLSNYYFLTPSGSVRQAKLNIKILSIK